MSISDFKKLYFEEYIPPSKEESDEILNNLTGFSNIKQLFQELTFLHQEEKRLRLDAEDFIIPEFIRQYAKHVPMGFSEI